MPVIETNIRRVYLHHYFADQAEVGDDQLMSIIERTLDRRNPRRWYWALMDYGAMLKGKVLNPNRRSKHYAKQSKFEGSLRQVRGAVLKVLTKGPATIASLKKQFPDFSNRLDKAIAGLEKEGFLRRDGRTLSCA